MSDSTFFMITSSSISFNQIHLYDISKTQSGILCIFDSFEKKDACFCGFLPFLKAKPVIFKHGIRLKRDRLCAFLPFSLIPDVWPCSDSKKRTDKNDFSSALLIDCSKCPWTSRREQSTVSTSQPPSRLPLKLGCDLAVEGGRQHGFHKNAFRLVGLSHEGPF